MAEEGEAAPPAEAAAPDGAAADAKETPPLRHTRDTPGPMDVESLPADVKPDIPEVKDADKELIENAPALDKPASPKQVPEPLERPEAESVTTSAEGQKSERESVKEGKSSGRRASSKSEKKSKKEKDSTKGATPPNVAAAAAASISEVANSTSASAFETKAPVRAPLSPVSKSGTLDKSQDLGRPKTPTTPEGWGDDDQGVADGFDLTAAAETAIAASAGARGYVAVEGNTAAIQELKALYESLLGASPTETGEEASSPAKVSRDTIVAALKESTAMAALADLPARINEADGTEETFAQVLEDIESGEEGSLVSMEEFLSYFGLGGLMSEKARAADQENLKAKTLETAAVLDEEQLMAELQQSLTDNLDGAAKLVVVGGYGATEGKRSVFRYWPKIWEMHTEDTTFKLTEAELFERERGSEYTLNDMLVLDIGSLHWSKPAAIGEMKPPRAAGSMIFQPTRIHAVQAVGLKTPRSRMTGGDNAPMRAGFMYEGNIQLHSLFNHIAHMVDDNRAKVFGEDAVGRVMIEALLYSWTTSTSYRMPGGMIPDTYARHFLDTLFYSGSQQVQSYFKEIVPASDTTSRTLTDYILTKADRRYQPREDGCRSPDAIRRTLLGDGKLCRMLPDIVKASLKQLQGTAQDLVVRVDTAELEGPAAEVPLSEVFVEVKLQGAPKLAALSPRVKYGGRAQGAPAAAMRFDFEHLFKLEDEEVAGLDEEARRSTDLADSTAGDDLGSSVELGSSSRLPTAAGGEGGEGGAEDAGASEAGGLATQRSTTTEATADFIKDGEDFLDDRLLQSLGDGARLKEPSSLRAALIGIVNKTVSENLVIALRGVVADDSEVNATLGIEKEKEVELGIATVSLYDLIEYSQDQLAETLELTSPTTGEVVGRMCVSVLGHRVLRMVANSLKKAYMDAFKVVLFGGMASEPQAERGSSPRLVLSNNLTQYNAAVNKWEDVIVAGEAPEPLAFHTAARVRSNMYVYGGFNGAVSLNALHCLSLENMFWSQPKLEGWMPLSRYSHSAVTLNNVGVHRNNHWMVVFGGRHRSVSRDSGLNDVCILDTQSEGDSTNAKWIRVDPAGNPPTPRWGHCCATMQEPDGAWRVYIFGGRAQPPAGTQPTPRPDDEEEPSAAVNVVETYKLDNTLYCLRIPQTKVALAMDQEFEAEWSCPEVSDRLPPAREGAQLEAVGDKLILLHGWVGVERAPWIRDCWILDTKTYTWISLAFSDHFPSARFLHQMALVDFRLSVPPNATVHSPLLEPGEVTAEGVVVPRVRAAAGEEVCLTLQARDARGIPADRCGDVFHATLYPDDLLTPTGTIQQAAIRDHGDATYSILFTPVVVGQYRLVITDEKNVPIKASTVLVDVKPGVVSVTRCVVTGPGLSKCEAGTVAQFTIDARDAMGNRTILEGDEAIRIQLTGPPETKGGAPVSLKVERQLADDGTVECSYMATLAGVYRLSIVFNGYNAPGSPFRVVCAPGPTQIGNCVAKGTGLSHIWFAGRQAKFLVYARDQYGNKRLSGGDDLAVRVLTHGVDKRWLPEIRGKVKDNANGSYTVTYTPEYVGHVTMSVTMKDDSGVEVEYNPILGSPFELIINPDYLFPLACVCYGDGCEAQLVAGETTSFTVQAEDKYGNKLITGGDWLECEIDAPKGSTMTAHVEDMMDGTYTVSYMPVWAGEHTLNIYAREPVDEADEDVEAHPPEDDTEREKNPKPKKFGKKMKINGGPGNEPKVMVVAAETAPHRCTATGDGIIGITVARKQARFLIQARDKFGNPRKAGGDMFQVAMHSGGTVDVEVTDNGDGTYLATYLAGMEEEYLGSTNYQIEVTCGGTHIVGSPANHTVVPLITFAPFTEAPNIPTLLTAGEAAEFTILAKDTEGKPVTRGLDNFKLAFIRVTGTKEEAESVWGDIKDLKDGRYLVRMVAEAPSYYKVALNVTLEGESIKGSPFQITVIPSGLFNVGFWGSGFRLIDEKDVAQFTLSGAGMEAATAGDKAQIDILSRRLEQTMVEADKFVVELRGPEFITGLVEGPKDGGVYAVSYMCSVAGTYTGTIKVGRFPLPGCPFQIRVSSDDTDPLSCKVEGDGLHMCKEGEEASFVLTTFDMHGNATYRDQDIFTVTLKGGGKIGKGSKAKFKKIQVSGFVKDMGNGKYDIRYRGPMEGALSLSVKHSVSKEGEQHHIAGSPFAVKCETNRELKAARKAREESKEAEAQRREEQAKAGAMEAAKNASEMAARNMPTAKKAPQSIDQVKAFVDTDPRRPAILGQGKKTGLAALFGRGPEPKPAPGVQAELPGGLPTEAPAPAAAEVIPEVRPVDTTPEGLHERRALFGFGFWAHAAKMQEDHIEKDASEEEVQAALQGQSERDKKMFARSQQGAQGFKTKSLFSAV